MNIFKRNKTPEPAVHKNEAAKIARRNFAFASAGRLTNDFNPGSQTADQAIFASLSAMRNRARQLERDDARVRKFLIMASTSVIGAKGIRLQSKAGDYISGKFVPSKYDQDLIENGYEEFSKSWNFSLDRQHSRRRFAQIGFQRVLVDGECIIEEIRGDVAGNFGVTYQMIDAERLDHTFNRESSPGVNAVRMGVELDELGRRVAYHFIDAPPLATAGINMLSMKRTRIPADRILHIYRPERPGQTRGITWLAPTGLRARMLDGIETAVSSGYRVAASKMGFLQPGADYEGEDIDIGDVPTDVAPGAIDLLPKGMQFNSFDAGYPNAEFDEFKKSIIKEIASGLGVSYPELGNDFQGVSYSAGQIGVHSDAALWSDLQQFWIETFEEPVFRSWLVMAITAGALPLPLSKLWKFQNVRFQPQRRKHIDPLKTHNAQRIALGDMSRSPFDVAAENGADFEDVAEETKAAIDLLASLGLPVPQSWAAGVQLVETKPDDEDNQ